ncbi:MAG TPA: trypsin-like peptidase domain-containing protein [Candidatus Hydrogenedentes bacterium]|jgi:serine protease Do|nr:trypsin-like peptidase domain-containing protein [Candidatus Hydrogenedentota bacterium]HOM47290.1 trypsin-like peptidase domain-containing protein [Candidatus Hydrogenedentota bacterium]HOR50182.1 trypsin-like peptidase domain-containing protein [Candidatus Hydrogenedentota bacterium]HPK24475.1 trypsin-like peptidase domain-containing protein [Candidatus Hydrogenedentota bacterium]HPX85565.1 trypsin-like peptidase domain-containing protein [Candidatus Hydrogenedentota bacterium]
MSAKGLFTFHPMRASSLGVLVAQVVCAVLLCFPSAINAQENVAASRRNAIVTAIEKVAASVVTINVVGYERVQTADPFFDNFMGLFDFAPGMTRTKKKAVEGIGTGFVFDQQGHILTNYHVLQNADHFSSVTLADGRNLDVEVVGTDERTDIAVLKAKTDTPLPYAVLGNSDDLYIGEWVIAIGNPFGSMITDPQPSVSVGVVSANHRRVKREVGGGDRLYQDMIQTDAAINPGNSGGPLVNAEGVVVGINTMLFSQSGGYQGIGFAIPGNRARKVAQEIIQFGRRRNPWFGFHGKAVEEMNAYSLRELQIQSRSGVVVTEILKISPAYIAGLQLGDVIEEVNGYPVQYPQDIDFINWDLFCGDSVRLSIDRQGIKKEVRFSVSEIRTE